MGNSLWYSPEDEQIATTWTNFYWLFSILAKNSMHALKGFSKQENTGCQVCQSRCDTHFIAIIWINLSWKLTRDGIKWQIAFQMFLFASPSKRRKYKTTNLVIIRAASSPCFPQLFPCFVVLSYWWWLQTRTLWAAKKKALSNNRWPLMLATTTPHKIQHVVVSFSWAR